jgi:putative ABC transport system permease protein
VEDKVLRLGQQSAAEIQLHFAAPLPVLVAAIAASLGTVLISAWLPARKAARIPAIEAIRSTGEVSLSRRDVSVSRLTQALFGFEGTLAAKSLKRNRRNFRATVLSLSISIVLLVSASSIGNLMKKVTGLMLPTMDATATASMNFPIEYDNGGNIIYKTLDQQKIKQITELLREYPETAIINVNTFSALSPVSLPREAIGDRMLKLIGSLHPNDASYDIGFTLVTLDDKSYAKTCELANVPLGSNILANIVRITERGSTSESNALNFDQVKSKVISLTKDGTGETFSLSIDGELSGSNVPKEIRYATSYGTAIIVPSFDATFSSWIAKVEDSAGFTDYASEVLHNNAPDDSGDLPLQILSQDISAQMARMDATVDTVMLFTYGFVGMLALMAIASVISAISTNVRSRSKEFAVLESVGMTRDGVSRMLSLESALCSLRSLAFGIPLGLAASFALYHAMGLAAEVEYSFPWLAVSQCVLGVFFVTWATMRYAASRLKRESIVSAMLSSDGA